MDKTQERPETYYIDFAVEGRYTVQAAGRNEEEALEKANAIMEETDFGELKDIEWMATYVG